MTFPSDRSDWARPRGQRVLYDDDEDPYEMWAARGWSGSNQGARVWYYESDDGVN